MTQYTLRTLPAGRLIPMSGSSLMAASQQRLKSDPTVVAEILQWSPRLPGSNIGSLAGIISLGQASRIGSLSHA